MSALSVHIICRGIFFCITLVCRRLNIINLTESPHSSTPLTRVLSAVPPLCKQLNYLAFSAGLRRPSSLPFPSCVSYRFNRMACFTSPDLMTQPDKEGNYCFAMLHKMQGSSQKACCPEAVRCDCSVSCEGMKWANSECDARLLPLLHPVSGFWLRPEWHTLRYLMWDVLASVSYRTTVFHHSRPILIDPESGVGKEVLSPLGALRLSESEGDR